jgi:hypothetical protein
MSETLKIRNFLIDSLNPSGLCVIPLRFHTAEEIFRSIFSQLKLEYTYLGRLSWRSTSIKTKWYCLLKTLI